MEYFASESRTRNTVAGILSLLYAARLLDPKANHYLCKHSYARTLTNTCAPNEAKRTKKMSSANENIDFALNFIAFWERVSACVEMVIVNLC